VRQLLLKGSEARWPLASATWISEPFGDESTIGELRMKKADMKVYKERLLTLRARLRGDVHTMADAALNKTRAESSGDLSLMPIHMADVGTDNYEQEFTLNLLQNDESMLELVEGALERIEDGVYGSCVECSGRVPKTRLNAIPYTPHCVKCASKLESH